MPKAGDRLHEYELLFPVGEGGMAAVWIARLMRKRGFEKLVAIKTILAQHAEDETFQEMFLDEARIASRIEHPNVAHVHDLGEEQGLLFLVMEYIDGHALTTLRKKLKKENEPFPISIAVRIMADACAGLQAAHDLKNHDGGPLGVVHRDVSPQNMLISSVGISKLIDFGVAKAVNRLSERTNTGFVKGKVHYMAPEQALSKPIDHRADIWGVGAVLYTVITGNYPFEADNHLALLSRLQREDPHDPLPPETPLPIVAIIDRALSHDPKQRFQTAEEMRIALEESGHMATHREVAQCLRDHLSAETEQRRKAINTARVEADARARSEEDAATPTTPNAPAATIVSPPPAVDEFAVTERKARAAPVDATIPLAHAPPELRALDRKPATDATAKLPQFPVSREVPPPSSSSIKIESGTNSGVATGGSYGRVPPVPAPTPAASHSKWILFAAGAVGLGLSLIVIAIMLNTSDRPAAVTPPPESQAVPSADAGVRPGK